MALGDYVRVSRAFLEAFKWANAEGKVNNNAENGVGGATTSGSEEEDEEATKRKCAQVNALLRDLKVSSSIIFLWQASEAVNCVVQEYQSTLSALSIKDDRIRRPHSRPILLYRVLVRLLMAATLTLLSLPGLLLWAPIFLSTQFAVARMRSKGPAWDTWDEIAQTKLVVGLGTGIAVWVLCVLLTLPVAPLSALGVPAVMWLTLRWFEDAVAASRALRALLRLLFLPSSHFASLRSTRASLHTRLMTLATQYLSLPEDPEAFFAEVGGREKGRVMGRWEGKVKYFSVRRRRKRDWNETLRLYDSHDYPDDKTS